MDAATVTINSINIYQGFFLSLVLFNRKKNKLPNNILSLIFLFFSLQLLGSALYQSGYYNAVYVFSFFYFPTTLLLGPLIYFYSLSMYGRINSFFKFPRFHYYIAATSLFTYIVLACYNHISGHISFTNFNVNDFYSAYYVILIIYSILAPVTVLIYTFISLQKLRPYINDIQNNFSNVTGQRLIWLALFLLLIMSIYIMTVTTTWLAIIGSMNRYMTTRSVLNFCFIFIASFFLLRKPEIFNTTHELLTKITVARKYEKNDIDTETKDKYEKMLLDFMESKKPYLDENISLKNLADELLILPVHLSIIINERLNKNFYNFINEYRIREVIAQLKKDSNKEMNILTIALQSGFNSKSSFNSTFKKFTGKTPSEYRNSLQ